MDVPFDIFVGLSFIALMVGIAIGACLRRKDEAPVDLRPQLLAYAEKVEELERPTLIEWTTRSRTSARQRLLRTGSPPMINPTAKDIDRRVIMPAQVDASGRIVSFDDTWVYVTDNPDAICGAPFRRDELNWFSGKDRE